MLTRSKTKGAGQYETIFQRRLLDEEHLVPALSDTYTVRERSHVALSVAVAICQLCTSGDPSSTPASDVNASA